MLKALGGALLTLGLALKGPLAEAAPPPIAAFFDTPSISAPVLSPNGRHLAVQVAGQGGRVWLAVVDLQGPMTPKVVAGFADADVYGHRWVNDQRLIYRAAESKDGSTSVPAPGLWAVDRDGSNSRQLIQAAWDKMTTGTHISDRRLELNWRYAGKLGNDGDEVLVARLPWSNEKAGTGVQFSRLNTRTGERRNLSYGLPDGVRDWHFDASGEPRFVESFLEGRHKTYVREGDGWRLWQDEPSFGVDRSITPLWFGANGLALVTKPHQGYEALFRLDPKTLQPEAEPLLSFKGYDFSGYVEQDAENGRLLGIHYETDGPGTVWFDPKMRAHQAEIDAKLPHSANRIACGRCLDSEYLLVTALSDQRPPAYWLYKPAQKQLQFLAAQRPDIKPAEMGQRDYHRIKTRDGQDLPVLVTQPAGGKPNQHPTVVLVHGGPFVRGTAWPWEPTAQFLASRGYLVLEPEFRGSTGYGFEHFKAGWKQWGLGMQDDLVDALAWAVKKGWADAARVCIMGGSYGGYAALMGAIKQADHFKCAIDWAGVTDIGLLSSIQWSDLSEEWRRYGVATLVGDPSADADQIRATSPLQRAKEVKVPLLLAYGVQDRRVPIKHGKDLKAALPTDLPVEWVSYPEEGHGWHLLQTHEDFWGRVERFLDKHIGARN